MPDTVATVDACIGIRPCFYWMSEERQNSMAAVERSVSMVTLDKSECQDVAIAQSSSTKTKDMLIGENQTLWVLCCWHDCSHYPVCIHLRYVPDMVQRLLFGGDPFHVFITLWS